MKKKIIYIGGFANQMTTYCIEKYLKLNAYEVESYFEYKDMLTPVFKNIKINNYTPRFSKHKKYKYLKRILNTCRIIYSDNRLERETIESYLFDKKIIYYSGVLYDSNLIEKIYKFLIKDFEFPKLTDVKNTEILKKIESCNSVSIHIRRGDYLNHPLFGEICNKEYYRKAIKIIENKVKKPVFFIFSNDIEWVKENIKIDNESYYIDWNLEEKDSYKDMQLMSRCKHNIIANSSFSWWGALLNTNKEKIVILPKQWIKKKRKKYMTIILERIRGKFYERYENLALFDWIKI